MSVVNGKNVVVSIYSNGAYRFYACATNCTLLLSTSTVETSTLGSGEWSTFIPQKHAWSGTLNGVVNFETGSQLNLYNLRKLQINKTLINIQFSYTDEGGQEYDENGDGYIVSSESTGDVNNVSTFTIELQGSGALIQVYDWNGLMINSEDGLLINSTDKFIL